MGHGSEEMLSPQSATFSLYHTHNAVLRVTHDGLVGVFS